jgi:hypothetical protein
MFFTVIVIYIVLQILNFYGISANVYGTYLVFFMFIVLSIFILPNNIPSIE